MLFSSLEFLYLFLPVTLGLYYLAPRPWRNLVLLLTSLAFYGVGEPAYVLLMVVTIAVDYAFGLAIAARPRRARGSKKRNSSAEIDKSHSEKRPFVRYGK